MYIMAALVTAIGYFPVIFFTLYDLLHITMAITGVWVNTGTQSLPFHNFLPEQFQTTDLE